MAVMYVSNATATGSGASLDTEDGAALAAADRAISISTAGAYFFHLDESSGAAEDDPNVVSPNTNAGTKRWILVPPKGVDGCDFLTGDTGVTKTWFYQNAAPTGWVVDAAVTDCVLSCAGGADAYNVAGGTTSVGTWTQPNHTHTGPSHTHTVANHTHTLAHTHAGPSHTHAISITSGAPSATIDRLQGGTAVATSDHTHAVTGNTGAEGTGNTGAASSDTTSATGLTSDAGGTGATGNGATAATWRPAGAVGKIFTLSV